MSFGTRLAQIREDAGLTQSGLARRVGTSQSAISQIEAGERNPSYEMIRQLADAFGVTLGYLIDGQVEGLKPHEEAHFRQYRSLSEEARRELEDYAAFLRSRQSVRQTRSN
jgi:transcriptional regulator with XRE-family HTH domain